MNSQPPPSIEVPAGVQPKDVFGRVATIITSLEEVISNRKIRKRSANLVRFRNQTVLTKAVEDLKRLSLQAKELTELNPTARDRYEATLWEMAADIFEDSQAVDRQA